MSSDQPSPYELWVQAGEDGDRYRQLLREHGMLMPLAPGEKAEPLPCGWPGPPKVIDEFRGRWAFLSNFASAVLVWEDATYPTSEHAFNAGKTLDRGRRQWIAAASTPGEAKRRGRSVTLRPGWDATIRFEVMAAVLRAKFTCRPERVAALLSTGDAELVEGNTWHDLTWGGFCRCGRPACAQPGANHLGRLLMELRAELRAAR